MKRQKVTTMYRSEIAGAVHEMMEGVHAAGLIGEKTMQEFDASCLALVAQEKGSQIHRPDFADVDEIRRRNMAAIAGKNTQPEMLVRRLAHSIGYRYRLHVKDLPGRPDIVFPARRKIIEIRGCFWHRHINCGRATTPATRADFWDDKFRATVARDARNTDTLQASGWAVMVIWECEVKNSELKDRLLAFLGPPVNGLATNAC